MRKRSWDSINKNFYQYVPPVRAIRGAKEPKSKRIMTSNIGVDFEKHVPEGACELCNGDGYVSVPVKTKLNATKYFHEVCECSHRD